MEADNRLVLKYEIYNWLYHLNILKSKSMGN